MPEAELAGVRIHYQIDSAEHARADMPVLVLSNSLGTDLHMWDKVAPALSTRFRLLRYDTRGHGLSSVAPPPYSIAELGGDLLRLMDHLKLERAHLCGVSLGGLTAMWLGIHAPERFDRLVFANTAPLIGPAAMWEERIAAIRANGMKPLAEATMRRWFTAEFLERQPEDAESARIVIEQTAPDGYIGCCMALRDADLRAEIEQIRARCLVITGEADMATPPADGRALHQRLPHSEYVELKAAHLSAWERPVEFQAAVLKFLE